MRPPKFHVSPDGESRRCRAFIQACDFGEENHYETKQAAREAALKASIEKQLANDTRHPVKDSDWDTDIGMKYQALLSFLDDNSRAGDNLSAGLQPEEAFYRNTEGKLTLDYDAVIAYVRSRGYKQLVGSISHVADGTLIQQRERQRRQR